MKKINISFLSGILLLVIYFSFYTNTAKSQSCVLKGNVKDEATLQAIPFANIIVINAAKVSVYTTTDFDGKFTIKLKAPGKYTVKVTYIGYTPKEVKNVIVKTCDSNFIKIKLKESAESLNEVIITGYSDHLISCDQVSSIRGSRSNLTVSTVGSSALTKVGEQINYEENIQGKLTASELNDFSKWDLWKDLEKNDLKTYQDLWKMAPLTRYAVQVKTKDGKAVVDAVVLLKSAKDELIWSSRTDNTGKAELWQDLFSDQKIKKTALYVNYENKEYKYENPNIFNKGINVFKLPIDCNIPDMIDIAFVVDATGSMNDEIKFLQSDLIDIINKTKMSFPDLKINLGSVFYRCFGNSYVTKTSPFSDNYHNTINFIKEQNSGEGGDEVVEEAFQVAVDNLKWSKNARARIIFFVMDEQPLTKPDVIAKMQTYTQKAAEKGIKVIPVIASAETFSHAHSLEYLMRSIALATNGTYVFLTDHSGIGDVHAKPKTDQYDVESLNTVLERIIYQNCYIPKCNEKIDKKHKPDTTIITNRTIIAHEIIDTTRKITQTNPKIIIKDFTQNTTTDSLKNDLTNTKLTSDTNKAIETTKANKIELKVFPNPTSGKIKVEIEGKVNELYLTDITGKLISKYDSIKGSSLEIDLSPYSNGIYFIKFYDNNQWYSGKIILTH